jgi:nitrogen fixation NifU-like protein
MADATLDALYQEVILDHNRRPRNYHPMPDATCSADGKNPNCGDQLTVWLKVEDEKVADVSFQGVGCAISKASASLMTQLGALRALGGVSKFPMRVKCASLSWHAMKAALDGSAVATTEGPEDARSAS